MPGRSAVRRQPRAPSLDSALRGFLGYVDLYSFAGINKAMSTPLSVSSERPTGDPALAGVHMGCSLQPCNNVNSMDIAAFVRQENHPATC